MRESRREPGDGRPAGGGHGAAGAVIGGREPDGNLLERVGGDRRTQQPQIVAGPAPGSAGGRDRVDGVPVGGQVEHDAETGHPPPRPGAVVRGPQPAAERVAVLPGREPELADRIRRGAIAGAGLRQQRRPRRWHTPPAAAAIQGAHQRGAGSVDARGVAEHVRLPVGHERRRPRPRTRLAPARRTGPTRAVATVAAVTRSRPARSGLRANPPRPPAVPASDPTEHWSVRNRHCRHRPDRPTAPRAGQREPAVVPQHQERGAIDGPCCRAAQPGRDSATARRVRQSWTPHPPSVEHDPAVPLVPSVPSETPVRPRPCVADTHWDANRKRKVAGKHPPATTPNVRCRKRRSDRWVAGTAWGSCAREGDVGSSRTQTSVVRPSRTPSGSHRDARQQAAGLRRPRK